MTQSLLPSNATPFEQAQSKTSARLLDTDTEIIRRERRPDQCDEKFLPLLAWETSVHHWTGTNEAGDRAAVANSFGDHCDYGSPAALEQEIMLEVGHPIRIKEFWEFGGNWPDFLIEIPAEPETPYAMPADVLSSAIRRKNVRDWPIVRVAAHEDGALNIAAQMISNGTVRILPMDPRPHFDTPESIGAALRIFANYHLRPFK